MPLPVIIDTDIGDDIDDTWALVMALNSPELDLRYILTCGHGHHWERAAIVASLLDTAGRQDIPIGLGCDNRDAQKPLFQAGAAGTAAQQYAGVTLHEDGVGSMLELVRTWPEDAEPLCIVAIGPLGNIAEALRRDPGMAERCRFVGMHGSIHVGYLGSPTPVREYNVYQDVSACRAVLEANFRSKTLTPLDTCGTIQLEGAAYQAVVASATPLARAIVEGYRAWAPLFVERRPQLRDLYDPKVRSSILFDCVAVYLAYTEDLVEVEEHAIVVDDSGRTIIVAADQPEACHNVRLALRWRDRDAFDQHLLQRILASKSTL